MQRLSGCLFTSPKMALNKKGTQKYMIILQYQLGQATKNDRTHVHLVNVT